MRRGARAVLARIAAAAAAAVVAAAAGLAVFVARPEWFLSPAVVSRAARLAGRGFSPRWSRLDFSIRSVDLLEKEVSFAASDLCFARGDRRVAGCLKRVGARFTVELSASGARVTRVDSLSVEGERLRVDLSRPDADSGGRRARPLGLTRLLPAALSGVRLGEIRVRLPSVQVAGRDSVLSGSLAAALRPREAEPLTAAARWTLRSRGAARRGRARLAISSDLFRDGRLTSLAARGRVEGEGVQADVRASARQAGEDALAVSLTGAGRAAGLSFEGGARGRVAAERLTLSGGLVVRASTGPARALSLSPFALTAEGRAGRLDRARLEADVAVEPAAFRRPRGLRVPDVFRGRLVASARASPTRAEPDHFDADARVTMTPYRDWYEVQGELNARASGRASRLAGLRVEHRLDVGVKARRFEDVVAFLAGTPYSIPAPLNVLKGPVAAALTARGDSRGERENWEGRALADLAGAGQRVKMRVDGSGEATEPFTPRRALSVSLVATLEDVALQLPHLDALKMPRATLDPRIKTRARAAARPQARAQERAGAPPRVALTLRVVTAKPLVLDSDLAKSPVPIALDMTFRRPPGEVEGTLEVQSFRAEFFRRRAEVSSVRLTRRRGSKTSELDGLVLYRAEEALIRVRLLGTTDRPQVDFESDPPHSQDEIVAMLLFGKSPDELDSDQTATVANARTAMADKAFGLASLYLFASTPIQFVGYDPASRSYAVRFRLPGGETLEMTSDFDETKRVQLRRRLSRHLAIRAEAVSSQQQGNGVTTFLEWFTRY